MHTTYKQLIILEESGKFVKLNRTFLEKRAEMSFWIDKNEILLKDEIKSNKRYMFYCKVQTKDIVFWITK